MKEITITTSKCTLLVVELPEGSHSLVTGEGSMSYQVDNFYKENGKVSHYEQIDIPKGEWKLLGAYPSITEEQASVIVEETDNPFWYGQGFKYIDHGKDDNCFETALESLDSLMEANGVYFENIICKDEPVFNEEEFGNSMFAHKLFRGKHAAWEEVQSKVFDKERTFLFIKQ